MKRVLACVICLVLAGLMSVNALGVSDPPGSTVPSRAIPLADSGDTDTDTDTGDEEEEEEDEGPQVEYDPNIAMTVRYDYDDQVRVGVVVPAFIEIANDGPSLDGTLRLSITAPRSEEANTYEMPIHVESGTKASFTLPFCNPANINNIKVHLLVKDEPVAEAARARAHVSITQSMLVGVLSDDHDSMPYRKSLTALADDYASAVGTVPVDLTAANFPEEFYMLDRFALIMLNHFNLDYLNEAQRGALTRWVNNGGRLLVDGDAGNKPAVESLKPIIELSVAGNLAGGTSIFSSLYNSNSAASQLSSFAGEYLSDRGLTNMGKLSPEPHNIVVGTESSPLISQYFVGEGCVFVTAFALNDIFFQQSEAVEVFRSITGLSAWNTYQLEELDYSYSNSINSLMGEAVRSIGWLDAPSIVWILVMLLGFIIVAGPVSYILLSKRDKRDLIWVSAPVLAVLCCAVIIGYGIGKHGTQPVSSVVTVVDSRGRSPGSQTYSMVGLAVPSQDSWEIRLEEEAFPYRLPDRDSYYRYYLSEEDAPAGKPAIHFDVSGYARITFPQIRQWNMDSFYLRRTIDLAGPLETILQYQADGVHYYVFNDTGVDLEDVTVVTALGYDRIPLLEAGETKMGTVEPYSFVQDQQGATPPSYYSYMGTPLDYSNILYELYSGGRNYYSYDSEWEETRTEDERREDYLKACLSSAMFDMPSVLRTPSYYGVQGSAAVWAWSNELGALGLTANGKNVRNELNRTMVIGSVDMEYGDLGELVIPLGQVMGTVYDYDVPYGVATYGDTYAYFEGEGEVYFIFQLPDEVAYFDIDRLLISSSSAYGPYECYLYNNSTYDWDEYILETELTGATVADYIDEYGMVNLAITSSMDDGDMLAGLDTEVMIDGLMIGVSGRER